MSEDLEKMLMLVMVILLTIGLLYIGYCIGVQS